MEGDRDQLLGLYHGSMPSPFHGDFRQAHQNH